MVIRGVIYHIDLVKANSFFPGAIHLDIRVKLIDSENDEMRISKPISEARELLGELFRQCNVSSLSELKDKSVSFTERKIVEINGFTL